MKSVIKLFVLLLAVNASAQSVSATYSSGDISTDKPSSISISSTSTCYGALTVNLPNGGTVTSVDIEYDMTASNYGYRSEQRSYVKSVNTGTKTAFLSGSGSGGTHSYTISSSNIANGTYSGNTDLDFEIHAFRTWTSSSYPGCATYNNKVDDGTWKVTVNYSLACSGTPVPGNTVASVSSSAVSSVCSGTTVDFSLDGSVGSDVDYQWESSTDGTNYSSISGATSYTYSAAISAAAYYRCAVTCSGSTAYSTAKQITLNSAPTTQATSLTFAATSTTITPTFTAASSADGYLIVSHTSALTAGPTDGTDYSSGTSIGGGTVGYSGALTTAALSSLTSNTNYSVTVYSYNESDDGCKMYNTTSPLTGTQYTAPGTVSSPVYANQTTSGFDLSWTAPSGATSFLYTVYSDNYTTAVSSSYENVAANGNSISVSGLASGTTYYVKVWAVGTGGTGNGYQAGAVNTLCEATSAPFTQDFGTGSSFINCWERYTGAISTSSTLSSTTSGWSMESSSTYRPDNFTGSFKEIYAYGSDGPFWLVSESIDLGSTVGLYQLKFDLAVSSSSWYSYSSDLSDHQLDIILSDDDGATWSSANTIATYTSASTLSNDGATETIALSNYSGTVRVAFVLTEGAYSSRYIGIDNFEIEAMPACNGIPEDGITSSSQSGAAGTNTTLSVSGISIATGFSYQWQSSSDNVNFSDISGATDGTYATTIGSSSSYYRIKTTCSNSNQYSMSWPVEVTPVNIVNLGSSGSQTNTCGTNITLYDDGGPSGNYSSNASGYIVLENSGTGVISITGTSNTESSYDDLIIYSGSGTSGSVVASYDGLNQTVSVTSSAGQTLTVLLDSDGSVEKAGIELTITYLVDCNGNTANISTPVTYDGSSWSQTPTSTDDVVFTGNYTVGGNEEYANVTVQGADITISPNKSLKVSGNLWIDATSTLTSESSAAGYSQLLVTGQIRNDGTIKQESTLKGNGAVGISSSMKEGFETTSGLTTSALKLYDASTGAYTTVSDLSEPGVGYYGMVGSSGVMSSTGTYDVTGNPVTNFTHTLNYTANQATGGTGTGWNLLGNPYTTLLDWSSVTKTNVNDAIYIWDRSGGKYKYHVNGVTAPTGSYISNALSSSLIPPMHAFWVQANNTGASVSSTMADDGTVSTSPGHFNKNRPDNIIVSVEEIGDSTNVDATWIINNGTSTMGFDGHSDAWKMHNYYGHNVFSTISDKDFAINAMDLSNDVAIPIGITDLDAGIVYMLKIDQLVNDDYYNVWLEDRLRQTKTAVSPEGYPFVDESYNGKDTRFVLHISNAASTNSVAVEELDNSDVSIFSDGTQIHLIGDLDRYHSYRIISANGQTLATGKITENMRLTAPRTSGIYVVQLIGANTAFSQKLSITK